MYSEFAQYGMKTSNAYDLDLNLVTNIPPTVLYKPESFFAVDMCHMQHNLTPEGVLSSLFRQLHTMYL